MRAHVAAGKAVFGGKARSAQSNDQTESADELSDEELEDAQSGGEVRRGKQRGWWKTGNVAASTYSAGMTAWVQA